MSGTKAVRASVEVELDRVRHLKLDLNAMVLIEEKTGRSVLNGDAFDMQRASDLRVLLWACLRHEDPDLTLEQVGEMIHLGNMQEVANAINEAWSSALPDTAKNGRKVSQSDSQG